jgi:hypothetical protein
MKYASVFLALLFAAGCASSSSPAQDQLAGKVQVQLGQVGNFGSNTYYFAGPVNIQYQLEIQNNTGVPVTLRRLQLRTISPGAYALRTPTSTITANVPSGKTSVVNLSAWGRTSGSELRAEEPVSIEGTAYFDSPQGNFVKIFTALIPQGSGGA